MLESRLCIAAAFLFELSLGGGDDDDVVIVILLS